MEAKNNVFVLLNETNGDGEKHIAKITTVMWDGVFILHTGS